MIDFARRLEALGMVVVRDVSLDRLTYWRVGGLADGLVEIGNSARLCQALALATEHDCPVFILGNASNLLISDRGIRGLVIRLVGELASIEAEEQVLTAGAGARLLVVLSRAHRHRWTGLECLAGIPGTIGGAVRMNAGTRLGEVKDILVDVDVGLPSGEMVTLATAELRMSYRTAHLPTGAVILRARLRLGGRTYEESQRLIREHLLYRKSTQPLELPSCGSTFRNPEGDHAGRLIEAAGLKGYSIGDAEVSTKHANFIVNRGHATAGDLRSVLEHVQRAVAQQFGVTLVPEVHFAGDWSGWSDGGQSTT